MTGSWRPCAFPFPACTTLWDRSSFPQSASRLAPAEPLGRKAGVIAPARGKDGAGSAGHRRPAAGDSARPARRRRGRRREEAARGGGAGYVRRRTGRTAQGAGSWVPAPRLGLLPRTPGGRQQPAVARRGSDRPPSRVRTPGRLPHGDPRNALPPRGRTARLGAAPKSRPRRPSGAAPHPGHADSGRRPARPPPAAGEAHRCRPAPWPRSGW